MRSRRHKIHYWVSIEAGNNKVVDLWWSYKDRKFIEFDTLKRLSSSGDFKTKTKVDKCIRRLMLENTCGRVVVTQFLAYSDTKGHLTKETEYWWGI